MKRISLLAAMLVLAAALYAHDKGDLMLTIEPQAGIAFPALQLLFENYMVPGIDFSLRATVDYYFTDSLALNVGLGYGGNYHWFVKDGFKEIHIVGLYFSVLYWPLIGLVITDIMNNTEMRGSYFASYITVPIGLRFAPGAFTMGAGATVNIPVYGFGEYERRAAFSDENNETVTFKLLPYAGWYADIGFDLSGRKKKKHGFGVLFRLEGSFKNEIAEPSSLYFKNPHIEVDSPLGIGKYKFNFVSASLVIRASFELANLPIAGKKNSAKKDSVF
jgi:hypothetical protein